MSALFQDTATPNDYRARAAAMEARGEDAYAAELRAYADKLEAWPVSLPGSQGYALGIRTWDGVEAYQRASGWRVGGTLGKSSAGVAGCWDETAHLRAEASR